MSSTVTLQSVVNLASTHGELMPLAGVGGYQNEPSLSLCNDTLQELLAQPHDWKFNSWDMPFFVTSINQQDYLFAGATAFVLGPDSGGAQIDLNGVTVTAGVVTVNFIRNQQAHQIKVGDTVFMTGVVMTTGTSANYNSTLMQIPVSSSWTGGWTVTAITPVSVSFAAVTGQNNADVGGAPGITNFGWLASSTCTELNNSSPIGNIRQMDAVRHLGPSQHANNPTKVCVLKTYQDATGKDTGIIKIRLEYPCASVWMVNPVYQAKAPICTSLDDTWAPFPDELGYVYRQGLLARMYRYLNSPQQTPEYQKLQMAIQKAAGGDDREASNVHVVPEDSLIGNSGYGGWF